MDAAAMERMAKHYWAMWGSAGSGGRSGWPAAHGSGGGGEPSWEEQAFAQDAAGHLGGCVWPPRSYTCSFCRREFRSAQALGGHMNVHRRDRARLRQCDDDEPIQQPIVTPPPLSSADHDQLPAAEADHSPLLRRRLSSPKSTAGDLQLQPAMATTYNSSITNSSPNSCIATIIKESRNKARLFITMPAADATTTTLVLGGGGGDYGKEEDSAVDEICSRKRRRVDQLPACERSADDPAAPADANKLQVITSPSSSGASAALLVHQLVGLQDVDLELRLGTTPA